MMNDDAACLTETREQVLDQVRSWVARNVGQVFPMTWLTTRGVLNVDGLLERNLRIRPRLVEGRNTGVRSASTILRHVFIEFSVERLA